MIKAIIDIGSNSIKMRIAKVDNEKVTILRDETEVVRLGQGMSSTGLLSEASMKAACEAVFRMLKRAEKFGAEIFIAGTMALRSAKNSEEFVKLIRETTGLEVHVLSGENEAKYSWLGAVDGFNTAGDVVMFDTGGGSTEFVAGSNGAVNKIMSVPIGAVNLSERFFYEHDRPIKKKFCDEAIDYVKNLFLECKIDNFTSQSSQIIGVGGGVVAMAGVKFACENFMPSKLHASTLTQRDVTRQIKLYASLTLNERENVVGLPKSRADVILGSACIVLTALKILQAPSCIVSINGLRHGLLLGEVNE